MKVAIVHDWLTGMRGGERVLEVFCQLFPDATIYTLFHFPGSVSPLIESMDIKTSFIQKFPLKKRYYRYFFPFFPFAVESFDLRGYDLVLSLSHCAAMGAITEVETCHICYCFTPIRYLWTQYFDYFPPEKLNLIERIAIPFFSSLLRVWEISASQRPDYFIAISETVAKRIRKRYRREAEVIQPPINSEVFKPLNKEREDFYLMVSALSPYKKVDLAIYAFNQNGLPLYIIGTGPEFKRLKAIAAPNIKFLGWQSDEVLRDYYARCKALIFPCEDDFGLAPLEAAAMGCPTIAYCKGGATETCIPHKTGIFFHHQTPDALNKAIDEFKSQSFDPEKLMELSKPFHIDIFKEKISKAIEKRLKEHHQQFKIKRNE